MSDAILRINNLSKTYGAKKALDGVSFEVERGKIYGFIGENGAGKTTAIRAITGLSPIENGTIESFGSGNNSMLLPRFTVIATNNVTFIIHNNIKAT